VGRTLVFWQPATTLNVKPIDMGFVQAY